VANEDLGGPDPDFVQDAHRDRQRQLRNDVRRRQDGSDDEREDDEVGAERLQLLDADDLEPGEHDNGDRHLEGSTEGDEHRHHEAQVGLDVRHRRDALRREALDESEDLAEDEEVAERDPEKEQDGARDDQRQDQLLLVQVKAWGDECPGLVEDDGQGDQERRQQRDLHRHQERRDHVGRDQRAACRQVGDQRRGEQVVQGGRPRIEEQYRCADQDRDRRADQAVAQFDEVRDERLLGSRELVRVLFSHDGPAGRRAAPKPAAPPRG